MGHEATSGDYEWTQDDRHGTFTSYCLTFVENATVEEVVEALPVVDHLGILNYVNFLERTESDWDEASAAVGFVQIGDAAVMYEFAGSVGVTPELMEPISRGRRILAHHYDDETEDGSFVVFDDGARVLDIDPDDPGSETDGPDDPGSETDGPDDVLAALAASGVGHPAVFAACERLTGVEIGEDTLPETRLRMVRVQMP